MLFQSSILKRKPFALLNQALCPHVPIRLAQLELIVLLHEIVGELEQ